MRGTSTRADARTAVTASGGTTPASTPASMAAISTSSHRWNLRSSDQTAPIAGRVYREIKASLLPFSRREPALRVYQRRPPVPRDLVFPGMRILIIGGTVFLGHHLTEAALTAGHEVTQFNRGTREVEFSGPVE